MQFLNQSDGFAIRQNLMKYSVSSNVIQEGFPSAELLRRLTDWTDEDGLLVKAAR